MQRSLLAFLCLAASAVAQPGTDPLGDPLPAGAVTRIGTVRDRIASPRTLLSLALTPDGKILAAEDRHGISFWDVDTGRPVRRFPWYTWQGAQPLFALTFSADGRRLARLGGRVVQVFEVPSGKLLFEYDLKDLGKGRSLAFVPNTNHLLVTSEESPQAFVLDHVTGKWIRTVDFEERLKTNRAVGRFVLGTSGEDWFILDPATGRTRARFPRSRRWPTEECVLSPDGTRAYVPGEDGGLRVVAADTGATIEDLRPPPGWDNLIARVNLAISPDGTIAYLCSTHRIVFRRDLKAGKWLPPLPDARPGELLPLPDGKRLLILGEDGVLRRYDLATLRAAPGVHGFEDNLFAFASPDGKRVVVESGQLERGSQLDLFEAGGRHLWSLRPEGRWGTPHWSPDGRWLACVGREAIVVRESATGKVAHRFVGPARGDRFANLAFFPPGGDHLLASMNFGQRLARFDLQDRNPATVIRMDAAAVLDLSPDGRTLVSLHREKGVRLLDLSTRKDIARAVAPAGSGRQLADIPPSFSPDGSYLLTWETDPGGEPTWVERTFAVLRYPVTLSPRREFEVDRPQAFAFSPDGLWLAIGTESGAWTLWDVPSGSRLGRWDGHRDSITSIGFAGSARVLTGSADLTALLWEVRPNARPSRPVWEALSGTDGNEAYRATLALASDPDGPNLLRTRVTVPVATPTAQVEQWIADLGADRFAVRQAATKALQELGREAEPALRSARDRVKAAEERNRLDTLLAKIPPERSGSEVTHARAVQALELAGTEPAKKLLAEWAAGAPGARLTIDAKAALRRMGPS